MDKVKYILLTLGLIASFSLASSTTMAGAVSSMPDICMKGGSAEGTPLCKSWETDKATSFVKILINALFIILVAVTLIVIIISGIYFVTSMGNVESIKKARETLTYAVVGLIVAILAYAIVNYVIDIFGTTPK